MSKDVGIAGSMLCPLEYLRENIRKDAHGLALSDTVRHLTFQDMQRAYKAISAAISSKVDTKNRQVSVAILLERNVDYICSMFASWELGGYFIPLNTDWPSERINEIIGKCKPDLVICHKAGVYQANNALYIEEIDLNAAACHVDKKRGLPSDIAYVMFTSGSTGEPKGVMITNESYLTYIEWTKRYFKNYSSNKRLLITAELTFDITCGDIAFAFAFGTAIFVAPNSKNIASLVRIVNEHSIDTFYSVPSTHNNFFNFVMMKRDIDVASLRLIISGGDAFSVELIKTIKKTVPEAHFYNVYGPTEVTINCFAIRVDNIIDLLETDGLVPIGLPFDIIDAVIIDEEGKDVTEQGHTGVLCVTGPQVMLGYFNDEETTSKAFVLDPRQPYINRKLYNTGDLAVKKSNGWTYLMGRVDDLVKIKGYRIHPNEVTVFLRKIEGIQEAATVVINGKRGKKLVSFVTSSVCVDKEELSIKLEKVLPKYMLPEDLVILDKMPLNRSDKVDKLGLVRLYQEDGVNE